MQSVKELPVYAIATNITSSLGLDVQKHWDAAANKTPGIRAYEDAAYSSKPFYASKIDADKWQMIRAQTQSAVSLSPFEQLAIFSAKQAIGDCEPELKAADTVVILSTTKGNVEWLGHTDEERLPLHHSATVIAAQLGLDKHMPVVVSQACVSGVAALTYALRLLQNGRYKNAVVIGCDRFTKFVLSGFQSFHAIDHAPCRPFDAARKGINLGEAAATIVLSANITDAKAQLLSGATSNDANHISGPSRTGEELSMAIDKALAEANITASQIDMVSAHGTATLYNDEMEAKAFGLSGLNEKPIHSFKGYTGHTLGAAGILESAMIIESLQRQQLIPSAGFEAIGVPVPLNITTAMQPGIINYVLKTASGFGGSNATAVWGRV